MDGSLTGRRRERKEREKRGKEELGVERVSGFLLMGKEEVQQSARAGLSTTTRWFLTIGCTGTVPTVISWIGVSPALLVRVLYIFSNGLPPLLILSYHVWLSSRVWQQPSWGCGRGWFDESGLPDYHGPEINPLASIR